MQVYCGASGWSSVRTRVNLVAVCWSSASTSRTFFPCPARMQANSVATVLLPVPPFSPPQTTIFAGCFMPRSFCHILHPYGSNVLPTFVARCTHMKYRLHGFVSISGLRHKMMATKNRTETQTATDKALAAFAPSGRVGEKALASVPPVPLTNCWSSAAPLIYFTHMDLTCHGRALHVALI